MSIAIPTFSITRDSVTNYLNCSISGFDYSIDFKDSLPPGEISMELCHSPDFFHSNDYAPEVLTHSDLLKFLNSRKKIAVVESFYPLGSEESVYRSREGNGFATEILDFFINDIKKLGARACLVRGTSLREFFLKRGFAPICNYVNDYFRLLAPK
ncbi:hypothetical protein GF386_06515 [Candidatus Pacearchaeota archaeon]|nr:hypothetical protein [Candidatus Pacearchaeota archaeon]MBD3283745.1 hypothetical protein [Candidatus Pacearchaeota archaeon]